MPSCTRALHAALDPYVESCVGYDYRLAPDATHHGLPSTTLTVVIAFDEPLDCGWLDDAGTRRSYWLLAAGLHTRPSLIETHGRQHGMQLGLTPRGAHALLGVPTSALGHAIVHADELAGGLPASLHEQLAEADWAARFDLIEQHLLRNLPEGGDPLGPEVSEAWRVLRRSRGRMRIDDLAAHVGWSRRHLGGRFHDALGITPKQAARVARFEHASQMLRAGLPSAEVANAAGFADQPHLNREWQALAAMSPSDTLQDFPIVQDGLP